MANYVIPNNDYLTDGYVDANFVGTDSDLYVNVGYTSDAIEGSASLTSSATLSSTGGFLIGGTGTSTVSATLSATAGKITSTSSSASSNATVSTNGVGIFVRSASISTSATTSTDADRIANAVIGITPAFTTGVTANAIVSPGGDISVSATTTASAQPILDGVVSIQAFQTHPATWNDAYTWDNDATAGTIIWGPMVEVSATGTIEGTSNVSTSATLTADADVTAIANISPAGIFTVSATGQFEVNGSSAISTSATVSVQGVTNRDITDFNISSAFTTTVSGIFQVGSGPLNFTSSGTLVVDGDRIASGVATPQASATVASTPSRTRPFEAGLTGIFNLSADATSLNDGVVIQAGSFAVTVDAISQVSGSASLSGAFTHNFKGGQKFGGIINIQGFAAQVSALTIYIIDPFRVYTIDSESRLLEIVEETRIYKPYSESRVNSIIAEIREFNVPSETRTLKTQHKKLVEVAGDPLDRRE